MKDLKKPKKPLIFYYLIGLVIIIALNLIIRPMIYQSNIKEVHFLPFYLWSAKKR